MKTQNSPPNHGCYLYAIVTAEADADLDITGIYDQKVYVISDRHLSAVVSNVQDKKIRPQRRNLAAHQQVLQRLMAATTPLPMAFGIIANGETAVTEILAHHRNLFLDQFQRVSGKVEMGLRVSWDVDNIFDYFVRTHSDLRSARDEYFSMQHEPSQEDKIELGRLFDHLLQEDRQNYCDDVERILGPYCHEIKPGKCRGEKDVMNLACLVPRDTQARFEEGVLKAAAKFDNNFVFDFNGPWAPHNFVEVELEI
jgi:hypothetical protein